jgi:hypothetical protein
MKADKPQPIVYVLLAALLSRLFSFRITTPPAEAIDIDANQPLKEVVDEILGLCGLDLPGDS